MRGPVWRSDGIWLCRGRRGLFCGSWPGGVERGQTFLRYWNETNTLRFQIAQLLNRGIKEFVIGVGHRKHRSAAGSNRTLILSSRFTPAY